MDKKGLSLAEIQEVPKESLTLLVGPPGAGKSTFCHHIVLKGIAVERPVIFITTEQSPTGIVGLLREKGMGESTPAALSFVDAFTETVGLTCTPRSDTICANCADLNSMSMATTKLQERMGQKGILLAFDSLTSPYLFCGAEVSRFIRLFLAKFAAQGNSVVALVDEGCGKSEDLVAMMSIADGVIKMETEGNRQRLNVVKHPKVMPSTVEVRIEPKPPMEWTMRYNSTVLRQFIQSWFRGDEMGIRGEVGDFLNPFWPNLSHWSGILWDPKGFPTMIYDLNKAEAAMSRDIGRSREMRSIFPLQMRLLMRALPAFQALGFFPKNFSKVKDMKKLLRIPPSRIFHMERSGIIEYLEDISKTDEHHFRIYESSDCMGFENIGTTIASHVPSNLAGYCQGIEQVEREWNAIETKCIGMGDPYCEFKLVPREIDELKGSLEKDSSVIERIHERLMEHLMGFLLHEKPLMERPRLGNEVHLHVAMHAMGFPHVAGERYRMAQRMGGAKSGKEIGERLIQAGIKEDEAIKRVIDFMNYCKVGKVTVGETIRIRENCESLRTKFFTAMEEPSCYFTTGFLNGLFSAVKKQHVREIKCITAGDPYCEWEII
jgi:predicted hydrocarbon binding protein/KaiC/GvpD/RAD55 family RecA-like ATPase